MEGGKSTIAHGFSPSISFPFSRSLSLSLWASIFYFLVSRRMAKQLVYWRCPVIIKSIGYAYVYAILNCSLIVCTLRYQHSPTIFSNLPHAPWFSFQFSITNSFFIKVNLVICYSIITYTLNVLFILCFSQILFFSLYLCFLAIYIKCLFKT